MYELLFYLMSYDMKLDEAVNKVTVLQVTKSQPSRCLACRARAHEGLQGGCGLTIEHMCSVRTRPGIAAGRDPFLLAVPASAGEGKVSAAVFPVPVPDEVPAVVVNGAGEGDLGGPAGV